MALVVLWVVSTSLLRAIITRVSLRLRVGYTALSVFGSDLDPAFSTYT